MNDLPDAPDACVGGGALSMWELPSLELHLEFGQVSSVRESAIARNDDPVQDYLDARRLAPNDQT